jgi:hypothetical protein
MPAEKQQQFRADIKVNSKLWDSEIEFTMPGELKLYRDYKLTGVSEYGSAVGKEGGKAGKGELRTGAAAKGVPKKGGAAKGVPKKGGAAKQGHQET